MVRIAIILLLCCSLAFGDTVNETVPSSDYDTGVLTGDPSAVTTATLSLTGTSMQFGKVFTSSRHSAFIFTSVGIAIGSNIDSVRVTFVCPTNGTTNTCNLRWVMEDTGSAAAFTDTADYNARSLTTATADWNDVPDWSSGNSYTFPSSGAASTTLADVIQEVVDRADWGGNGNLCFFLYDNASSSSAQRQAASDDHSTLSAPTIDIWFTPPSGVPSVYHGVAGIGRLHSPQGNSVLHKK